MKNSPDFRDLRTAAPVMLAAAVLAAGCEPGKTEIAQTQYGLSQVDIGLIRFSEQCMGVMAEEPGATIQPFENKDTDYEFGVTKVTPQGTMSCVCSRGCRWFVNDGSKHEMSIKRHDGQKFSYGSFWDKATKKYIQIRQERAFKRIGDHKIALLPSECSINASDDPAVDGQTNPDNDRRMPEDTAPRCFWRLADIDRVTGQLRDEMLKRGFISQPRNQVGWGGRQM